MSPIDQFRTCFSACPLIAIIRGVRPDEVEAIGGALVDAGIKIIEVPLNSPDPFDSIERLARRFGQEILVGAGTLLHPGDAQRVADVGGRIAVSPGTDITMIAAVVAAGMVSAPGFFTPSEGFAAIRAGAHALKLFPAEAASPRMVKAMRAVFPADMPMVAVGGITAPDMADWFAAGIDGFGLGGSLFRPGDSPADVTEKALVFTQALCAQGRM